jgi:hypothetical protein
MATQTTLEAAAQRFATKTRKDPATGCWNYTGAIDRGYGRFWVDGRTVMAHRFAWEQANGPVPDGKQLDHLCRNRSCVNPGHLEPVTIGENVLRGIGLTAENARKTSCRAGHPFTQANTYVNPRGERQCRTCQRQRVIAWRERQKGAAA